MFVHRKAKRHFQHGGSFMSSIRTGYNFGKANLTLPQKYKGEKHAVQQLPNGQFVRGSYIGPGTHVIERIRNGSVPVSMTDKVAQAHDLRYSLANDESDIRNADIRMMNKLKNMKANKQDTSLNINQGLYGIKAKVVLEDLGVPKTAFTTFGRKGQRQEDIEMLEKKEKDLSQQGFGKRKKNKKNKNKKKRPAMALLRQTVSNNNRKRQSNDDKLMSALKILKL